MSEISIFGICTGVNNRVSNKNEKFCIVSVQLENGNCDFFVGGKHLPVFRMGTPLSITGRCRIFDHKCNGFENLVIEEVKA